VVVRGLGNARRVEHCLEALAVQPQGVAEPVQRRHEALSKRAQRRAGTGRNNGEIGKRASAAGGGGHRALQPPDDDEGNVAHDLRMRFRQPVKPRLRNLYQFGIAGGEDRSRDGSPGEHFHFSHTIAARDLAHGLFAPVAVPDGGAQTAAHYQVQGVSTCGALFH
jgi:hypothetical protein